MIVLNKIFDCFKSLPLEISRVKENKYDPDKVTQVYIKTIGAIGLVVTGVLTAGVILISLGLMALISLVVGVAGAVLFHDIFINAHQKIYGMSNEGDLLTAIVTAFTNRSVNPILEHVTSESIDSNHANENQFIELEEYSSVNSDIVTN